MTEFGSGIWRRDGEIRVLRCPSCHRMITVADGRLVPHRDAARTGPCRLSEIPVEDRRAPRRPPPEPAP